jgi:hypothetical protein
MKAKKEGKIDSIGSIFKKKTENYEKRMSPAPESVEVRKSLGNI